MLLIATKEHKEHKKGRMAAFGTVTKIG